MEIFVTFKRLTYTLTVDEECRSIFTAKGKLFHSKNNKVSVVGNVCVEFKLCIQNFVSVLELNFAERENE